jgi:phosphohistidine phosphatase
MKTLYLLRHAKSDWNLYNITDFDRPLNERGLKDAKRLSAFLEDGEYSFDKIYCSAAVRTTQTHDRVLGRMGAHADTEFLHDLYHCNSAHIVKLLKMQPNSVSSVMIINHMPTIQIIYEMLSGESIDNYPTCTFSAIEFSGDWVDIDNRSCSTKLFLSPKHLKQRLIAE